MNKQKEVKGWYGALNSFKMLIRKSDFGGFLPWARLVCDTNVHLAEAEIRGFFRRARFVCATNVHLAEAVKRSFFLRDKISLSDKLTSC